MHQATYVLMSLIHEDELLKMSIRPKLVRQNSPKQKLNSFRSRIRIIPSMSTNIDAESLSAYRAQTFQTTKHSRLIDVGDAIEFVNARGFVFLWPVKGVDLPSLWSAAAGGRPVESDHDDPGHVTWGWKDSMLGEKVWYYAKILRGKATFVSLDVIPYFYALSERVGDLDDYLLAYDEGRLTWEQKSVADAILNHGALHTLELRRRAFLDASGAKSRFDRALTSLQRGLWILPIGIARAGAWKYAFIYEFVDRWYPQILDRARKISVRDAYKHLTSIYLDSVGAIEPVKIARLFRWKVEYVHQALIDLEGDDKALALDDGRWATSTFG
jgi:hypothetical protein